MHGQVTVLHRFTCHPEIFQLANMRALPARAVEIDRLGRLDLPAGRVEFVGSRLDSLARFGAAAMTLVETLLIA